MKKLTWIAGLLALMISVQACNENRKAKNYNEKTLVDDTALGFIKQAIEGGNAEVQLSQIALKNSQNADVKNFANMMIKDHTAAGNELKKLAGDKFVNVPDSLTVEHEQLGASLSKKTGAEFDKEYMQAMVTDHEKTIALFKGVGTNKNGAVNDYIEKTLPKLEMHLKEANGICLKLK